MSLVEFIEGLKRTGIPFRNLTPGGTLADIADLARRTGEPVIFVMKRWDGFNHFMTAYSGPRGVYFMDRLGDFGRLMPDGSLQFAKSIIAKGDFAEIGFRFVVPEAGIWST